MVAQANDVLNADPRTKPVVIYQLTWSEGGDVLVVKDGIKEPKDLAGKKIVLQAYGPHVDYLTTVAEIRRHFAVEYQHTVGQGHHGGRQDLGRPGQGVPRGCERPGGVRHLARCQCAHQRRQDRNRRGELRQGSPCPALDEDASRIIADVYVVRSDWFAANENTVFGFRAWAHAGARGQRQADRRQATEESL